MPSLSLTHGGINLPGSTYLWNPLLDDGITPPFSPQGVISYWHASSQFGPGTILTSYPYWPTLGSLAFGITVQHILLGTSTRFRAYLTDGTGNHAQDWIGLLQLAQDGAQHHVAFTFDSANGQAAWSYDGTQQTWDPIYSSQLGAGFDISANGIAWTIGAWKNGAGGQQYYNGYLSELYGHFFPSDYDMLHAPNPAIKRGFAQRFPLPGSPGQIVFGPLDLGPGCSNVFGAAASPLICQRDYPGDFIKSTGGQDFQVVGPPLGNALTNPFELIP